MKLADSFQACLSKIMRDLEYYINAFAQLKKTDKSVHRMLGPRGNPRADNILEIIKILQANERVKLRVEAHKAAA